jgi:hypothetical protein
VPQCCGRRLVLLLKVNKLGAAELGEIRERLRHSLRSAGNPNYRSLAELKNSTNLFGGVQLLHYDDFGAIMGISLRRVDRRPHVAHSGGPKIRSASPTGIRN